MNDTDLMLRDLWADTEAPRRDARFVAAVVERIERRRFWLSLLSLLPTTVVVAAVAWALAPAMTSVASDAALSFAALRGSGLVAMACALTVASLIMLRRPADSR